MSKPRPYSEAHEKLGFEAFSSANKEKVVFELENSIFQKLFEIHSNGQKWILITSQVSHNDLGPISDAWNEFGEILKKMKILNFSSIFSWISSLFYA